MTVAAVPPGGAVRSNQPRPKGGGAKPAQPFADLLGRPEKLGNNNLTSAPSGGLPATDLLFDLKLSISDDAVRFDARPLVGPTGTVLPETAGSQATNPVITQSEGTDGGEDLLPEVGIGAARALVAELGSRLIGQWRGTAAPIDIPVSQSEHVMRGGSVAAQTGSVRLSPANATTVRVASDSASPASRPQQNANLFARMILDAAGIQLVIHGARLSPTELATLADELKGLLGTTRFGNRPVRIIASGRNV